MFNPQIFPPAQKPASVSGDSGAALVGNLNAFAWRAIADFLDAQHLASFGLSRVARKGPACGKAPREAVPVGNTGITTLELANHV